MSESRPKTSSAAIAAVEAHIADTRKRLDLSIAGIRGDLAVPIALAAAATNALGRAAESKDISVLVRRHAIPLGLIGVGLAWIAAQHRDALGRLGAEYGKDLLESARALGVRVIEAATAAALETLSPPAGSKSAAEAGAAPDDAVAAIDAAAAVAAPPAVTDR